jgi:hypothetical protein
MTEQEDTLKEQKIVLVQQHDLTISRIQSQILKLQNQHSRKDQLEAIKSALEAVTETREHADSLRFYKHPLKALTGQLVKAQQDAYQEVGVALIELERQTAMLDVATREDEIRDHAIADLEGKLEKLQQTRAYLAQDIKDDGAAVDHNVRLAKGPSATRANGQGIGD